MRSMRNVSCIAAISIAVFVSHIGEFGSARAETKAPAKKPATAISPTPHPLAPHWNHNGFSVSLVSQGAKQKLFYESPRVGLLDAGVKPGTLLFEGQRNGQNFDGTAYQFYRTCKAHGYAVTGSASDDRKTITLKGKAPLLDMNCNVTGSRDDILVFTANQPAPSEPPKENAGRRHCSTQGGRASAKPRQRTEEIGGGSRARAERATCDRANKRHTGQRNRKSKIERLHCGKQYGFRCQCADTE